MLTSKKVEAAKGADKQYKLSDAQGLYLAVTTSGTKSWRYDYKLSGKYKTKVYGKWPDISLADARRLHVEFKDELDSGSGVKSKTFDLVKALWYAHQMPRLKNAKHRQQVQYRLDHFVSTKIGSRDLATIRRAELVEIVMSVQNREAKTVDTAHRVATHIRQVFDYAVDLGLIELHPASGLSRVLKPSQSEPMPCVSLAEAPALLKKINALDDRLARAALLFLCVTFVRTNEFRYMEFSEVVDERFWVVPESRMKLRKPHVVPLSDFALELLAELRALSAGKKYVLQSKFHKNAPMSENYFLHALERLGYKGKMTGHGFRALASTALNSKSGFSADVIERQLAHKERNEVRAAYNRAEYLEERIELMNWYSDWVKKAIYSDSGLGNAERPLKALKSIAPMSAD